MMANPDERNKKMGANWTVRAYFTTNGEYNFPARDERNAREIAKRIITEGIWIIDENGVEEMYPVQQVYKVKIIPPSIP